MILHEKPSRLFSKNGNIERNDGVFKEVLERISKESTKASDQTIVERTSFFTNMFHGSSILSAFLLAWKYVPSILEMPSSKISKQLLDAHIRTTSSIALNCLLRSKDNHLITSEKLPKGIDI